LLPWTVIAGHLDIANAWGPVSVYVGVAGAAPALVGLLLYEHAYVQAGQSVPLA
jgi:hypothetical protein